MWPTKARCSAGGQQHDPGHKRRAAQEADDGGDGCWVSGPASTVKHTVCELRVRVHSEPGACFSHQAVNNPPEFLTFSQVKHFAAITLTARSACSYDARARVGLRASLQPPQAVLTSAQLSVSITSPEA